MINTLVKNVSYVGIQHGMPLPAIKKRVVFNWSNALTVLIAVYGLLYLFFAKEPQSRISILLASVSILFIAVVAWILVHNGRFRHSVNISFILFPPLFVALSVATHNMLVEVYLLILCLVAFFLIKKKRHINITFLYIMVCFIAGHLMITEDYYPHYTPKVFVHIAAFLALYITLGAIKFHGAVFSVKTRPQAGNYNTHPDTGAQLQKLQQEVGSLQQKVKELSELNDVKTILFSVLAHDLKDNIYSVNRNLEIAGKTDDGRSFFKETLPLLKEETGSTIALLQRLLQWGKTLFHSAHPDPRVMDINSSINDVIKLYTPVASKKGVRFITKIEAGIFAFADPDMIDVVLRNLVANAVKYNSPGFPVSIFTEKQEDMIQVSIIDYGAGMDEAQLKMMTGGQTDLMDGNVKCVGLGLLLCRELLHRNNGAIHITSTPGMGTKVVITIPAAKNQ